MLGLLWLIPALPFAGFLILALAGPRLSRTAIAWVGVGSVGLAAALALAVGAGFLGAPAPGSAFTQTLWTWMDVGGTSVGVTFYLDALSLLMVVVITFVGFLIHLYSTEYMLEEEGYNRFFAYMNLFVGSMLVLVLAGNLVLLLLGWEGVGLCSYLLIGFFYRDPANGRAARKAFVVTRVGDTALLIGLFLIFNSLGTLDIQQVLARAPQQWGAGSALAVGASLLLLGGAVGKSAQLPLQTWLPDAMAGPTPVSALIHAATMVTAGVYLIARTNVLFSLAPSVQTLVAIVGALTMLLAGFSALVQWDIKRVLAYSTMSQIGLMFLGLGVGAWTGAMFHFFTHAFFKALLFLGAGVVMHALHGETDMRRMGGLRRDLSLTYWTFLAGAASLAALPLVTAGFYSKDLILASAWASPLGNFWLWAAGAASALLTALYTFRMVFLTFLGAPRQRPTHFPDRRMTVPLVVLAFFAIFAGFVDTPAVLGNARAFSDFLRSALPVAEVGADTGTAATLMLVTSALALLGLLFAYFLYFPRAGREAAVFGPTWGELGRFWLGGWGFDWFYHNLLVRPYVALSHAWRGDPVDLVYQAIADANVGLHRAVSATESGKVRWYALGLAIGVAVVAGIGVWGGLT
ncbi:MAG: NADH-quinone oxidoreductase subunit L [Chloroflexota bacterium]